MNLYYSILFYLIIVKMVKSKIIFLGDSHTQRGFSDKSPWLGIIANKYVRKFDILNYGFSGYNSKWINWSKEKIFNDSLLNVVGIVIFIGSNDSTDLVLNQLQSVPIDQFIKNYNDILDYLKCMYQNAKVFLISPPPCCEKSYQKHCYLNDKIDCVHFKNVQHYANTVKKIAQYKSCQFIDCWSKFVESNNIDILLEDGLHLNYNGAKLLATIIIESFEQNFQNLFETGCNWRNVDFLNQKESLLKEFK
ncbi:Isoamyl acetate-hydrolyzing esterase 1 [Intoshia linei]|uniref:Isoamyl acetate-hydrolyzing esterase 1 n=1 Tax=Intoshia linei TaxID=1819745 RepID=A0A177B2U0_9BILA|nr:Isoamyl acetate-hydrolyzing esterase 1 [Intoshia linei]